MNSFLFVIILGLCFGGYYEYTAFEQKNVADPHQAAALTEAQIQFQEEQRKAAAEAAGH